jgi:hypothetical protein
MKRRRRVTHERLRELLRYNRKSGEFRWRKRMSSSIEAGDIAGGLDKKGYQVITINGRPYPAHQLAWLYIKGKWCSTVIDHRDGDPSNNCWRNLRRATISQNNANRPLQRNNTCGLKGVSSRRGIWCAGIRKNRQRYHLGYFETPQEAHAAYAKAARKLFGKFARTE